MKNKASSLEASLLGTGGVGERQGSLMSGLYNSLNSHNRGCRLVAGDCSLKFYNRRGANVAT
jgi:hypothetical protein